MNILLWSVQAMLAVAFLLAGGMKLVMPVDDLIANGMIFVQHIPTWLLRFIGGAEVAGAIGLIVPSLLRIQPKLTPIAAGLLAVVMVLAIGTHVMLAEYQAVGGPLILGVLSSLVAWGRWHRFALLTREHLQTI